MSKNAKITGILKRFENSEVGYYDAVNEIMALYSKEEQDTERLDKLDALKGGGNDFILRDSNSGRGIRLHQSATLGEWPTVREAIDNYKPTS